MEALIRRIKDNIQQILDFVPADREIEECPAKYNGKCDVYIRDVYNWWLVHKGTDSVGVEAGRKLSSFVLHGIRPGKGWENSWCLCAALTVADMYRDNNSGLLTCLAERSDVFLKEAKKYAAETGRGPSEEAEAVLKEVLDLSLFREE